MNLIERALHVFDSVIVAVANNPDKRPLFSVEERMEMIRLSVENNPCVTVDSFDGLLVDYAKAKGVRVVLRGMRAMSDFEYEYENEGQEQETLDPSKQRLKVYLDTKAKKKGKQATLISGFVGSEEDLKDLGKLLKTKCAVGGSVKEGDIIIQGDFRDKIVKILESEGYNAKRI